jgi:hypothetical protein
MSANVLAIQYDLWHRPRLWYLFQKLFSGPIHTYDSFFKHNFFGFEQRFGHVTIRTLNLAPHYGFV